MNPSLTVRLREGLPHRARGGHDRLTSTTLPAGCTIRPPDAGSRQCPWVTALPTEQSAGSTPSDWWRADHGITRRTRSLNRTSAFNWLRASEITTRILSGRLAYF